MGAIKKVFALSTIMAALILLGSKVRSLYNFTQQLTISIGNPHSYDIIGGVFGKLKLILPVIVSNPSDIQVTVSEITIKGFEGNGETAVVTGSYVTPTTILSRNNTVIPITLFINIPSIVLSLSKEGIERLKKGLTFGKDITFAVNYKVDGLAMPTYTDTITL
jgi:hypothetical protein